MTDGLPHIADVAQRAIGSYLRAEGFKEASRGVTQVEFARTDVLLRLSYYAEDPPPRGINIGLGIRHEDGSSETLGLWALIPDAVTAGQYPLWKFTAASELESALIRVRDEVLQPFAAQYWSDPDLLLVAIRRESSDLDERHSRILSDRYLNRARRAFAAGSFRLAVDSYVLAGNRLSEVDVKKLKIARRELGPER